MFYSHDILQKRGGKFGTVWAAAMQGVCLTRRDYARVNIPETCEDIIKYITLQGRPYRPGGPRPRLSLYLSSQLMFGTIKIYDTQYRHLLTDASALSQRCQLMRGLVEQQIDLPPMPRAPKHTTMEDFMDMSMDPTFPDNQLASADVVRLEDIPDVEMWMSPVFGDMQSPLRAVPPTLSYQELQPDIPLPTTPRLTDVPFRAELGSPLQVQRPEDITLREGRSQDELRMEFMMLGEELPPLVAPGDQQPTVPLIPPETDQQASTEQDRVTSKGKHQRPSRMVDDLVDKLRKTAGTTSSEDEPNKSPSHAGPKEPAAAGLLADDPPMGDVITDAINRLREVAADQSLILETDAGGRQGPAEEQLWKESDAPPVTVVGAETSVPTAPDASVSADGQLTAGEQSSREKTMDDMHPIAALQEAAALAPTEETPAVLPDPELMNSRPKRRTAPTPGVTPGSPAKQQEKPRKSRKRIDISMELQPVPASPVVRRRRGHLIVDKEIQIPKKKIRANLTSGASLCNHNFLPEPRIPTVDNLFKTPASRMKNPVLVALWKRNAVMSREPKQVDDDKPYWTVPITSESSGSERESPLAQPIPGVSGRLSPVRELPEDQLLLQQGIPAELSAINASEVADVSEIARLQDVSAQEQLREASRLSEAPGELSASFIAPDTTLHLSMLSRQSRENTPDRSLQRSTRSSSRKQGQLSFEEEQLDVTVGPDRRSLAAVQELPEESQLHEKTPVAPPDPSLLLDSTLEQNLLLERSDVEAPSAPSASEDEFEEKLKGMVAGKKAIKFVDLCPYTMSRADVASWFTQLLGLCAQQKITARQDRPYEDIYITKGKRM